MTDDVAKLEAGELVPPAPVVVVGVVVGAELVRRWVVGLGLRPGSTRGPTPKALVPVLHAWAGGLGAVGPSREQIGLGLTWAGLRRRWESKSGGQHLLLHRDDAARLWRLTREAWAPQPVPGGWQKKSRPRRKRGGGPTPTFSSEPSAWAEACAAAPKRSRPVVDSLGRVWPSPVSAARALHGSHKALANAMSWLRQALHGPTVDAQALSTALRKAGHWRGVWWRYLTPGELAAVPPEHMVGTPLPGYGWGLTCPKCGGHPAPK